jgi:hypothetical protein
LDPQKKYFPSSKFYVDLHTYRTCHQEQFFFWEFVLIPLQLILKNQQLKFGLKNVSATYQNVMNLIFHDLLGIILEIYIDDVIVKSDSMNHHLADFRLALERMCRYRLKMNPLKCVFGASTGKFLGFIIHENGIEIDPKKVESIQKVQPSQSKNNKQKYLGKLNYLMRFIFNLLGKISAFVVILHLKNEANFTWGQSNNSLLRRSKSTCLRCRG